MTEGEVEGEKENKGSQGTPALRNTKNETPLFPFLSHRKREPKQGVIGLVLVNAEGRIVRETGDVRARDEKSKEEKSKAFFFLLLSFNPCFINPFFIFNNTLSKKSARRLRPRGPGWDRPGLPWEGHGPRRRPDGESIRSEGEQRTRRRKKNAHFLKKKKHLDGGKKILGRPRAPSLPLLGDGDRPRPRL